MPKKTDNILEIKRWKEFPNVFISLREKAIYYNIDRDYAIHLIPTPFYQIERWLISSRTSFDLQPPDLHASSLFKKAYSYQISFSTLHNYLNSLELKVASKSLIKDLLEKDKEIKKILNDIYKEKKDDLIKYVDYRLWNLYVCLYSKDYSYSIDDVLKLLLKNEKQEKCYSLFWESGKYKRREIPHSASLDSILTEEPHTVPEKSSHIYYYLFWTIRKSSQ